jgi:hypothetical protein
MINLKLFNFKLCLTTLIDILKEPKTKKITETVFVIIMILIALANGETDKLIELVHKMLL